MRTKGTMDLPPVESSRLKQVNLELGQLAREHHACRLNSFAFSGIGAVVLAISAVGLIHLLPSGEDDWVRNPDSPVYAIASEHEQASTFEMALVTGGFALGLGLFFRARTQCSKQRTLWKRERDLRMEMRRLRDRLYAADRPRPAPVVHRRRSEGHTAPLDPDEARGEYVGVYNPPASHQGPG